MHFISLKGTAAKMYQLIPINELEKESESFLAPLKVFNHVVLFMVGREAPTSLFRQEPLKGIFSLGMTKITTDVKGRLDVVFNTSRTSELT